jgi:hypothetical protein
MNRQIVSAIAVVAMSLASEGQASAESAQELSVRQLLRVLEEAVETKDFQDEQGFEKALVLLKEKLAARGKELGLLVHNAEFKEGTHSRQIIDGQLPIKLPPSSGRLPLSMVLRLLLAQLDDEEATFLIRNGVVEILPARLATPGVLLQTKIAAVFARVPLEEALQILAYQTGMSIVLDNRASGQSKTNISATFRNDVTLEAAARLVAEMAELKLVVMPAGLFVTTPAHAEALQREGLTGCVPVNAAPVKASPASRAKNGNGR